jgi:hypothetical protein
LALIYISDCIIKLLLFVYCRNTTLSVISASAGTRTLDILVENWGRVNYGVRSTFDQRKGLLENTKIVFDDKEVRGWEIISLQFKSRWVNR